MGSELALPGEGRGGGEARLFWNSPEGDSERSFAILSLGEHWVDCGPLLFCTRISVSNWNGEAGRGQFLGRGRGAGSWEQEVSLTQERSALGQTRGRQHRSGSQAERFQSLRPGRSLTSLLWAEEGLGKARRSRAGWRNRCDGDHRPWGRGVPQGQVMGCIWGRKGCFQIQMLSPRCQPAPPGQNTL